MSERLLKVLLADEVPVMRRDPVDSETLAAAAKIVEDVRDRGEAAVIEHAIALGDLEPGQSLYVNRAELEYALAALDAHSRGVLERTAGRIKGFALAQRESVQCIEVPILGGVAGHDVALVERAGCYAPGGRFPLPSSVLMTAVTARAAGVKTVWVASPRPTIETLAAAAIAGAD